MARSKLASKKIKSEDGNDIKILLATTLISILLAAFLLNTLIQPAAAISSDETVVPEESKDWVRVKEKVGEVTLWTPILIVTSPPRGYAKGSVSTTAKVKFKLGTFKWESSGTWEYGIENVLDGTYILYCKPAVWEMYHIYDKDWYHGYIIADYGYHAKIKKWLVGRASIRLGRTDDYRDVNHTKHHENIHGSYDTVWVDLSYKKMDDYVDTTDLIYAWSVDKVGRHDGFGGEVDIKVKLGNYISMGILHFDFTCSESYYIEYHYPPGYLWDIDYLGPTKKKVWKWWPPPPGWKWIETGPPIAAFVLHE